MSGKTRFVCDSALVRGVRGLGGTTRTQVNRGTYQTEVEPRLHPQSRETKKYNREKKDKLKRKMDTCPLDAHTNEGRKQQEAMKRREKEGTISRGDSTWREHCLRTGKNWAHDKAGGNGTSTCDADGLTCAGGAAFAGAAWPAHASASAPGAPAAAPARARRRSSPRA